jgi:hypothetical protein
MSAITSGEQMIEREARRRGRGGRGTRRWQAAAWPAASRAAAHRRGPQPQRGQPRTRQLAVPAVTHPPVTAPARASRAVLPRRAIVPPRKDHSQGRTSSLRCGRSTLTLIFHGNIGTCREDRGLAVVDLNVKRFLFREFRHHCPGAAN